MCYEVIFEFWYCLVLLIVRESMVGKLFFELNFTIYLESVVYALNVVYIII